MEKGSEYEAFVQKLQQALLDAEAIAHQKNIKVERNKKIKDNCGNWREFDLYWEYELAGVTYKTIIECKDYASRVSVEKIDALIGKIRDIPGLKPIFATTLGYQRGAEKKALQNCIDLLIVREQRDQDWRDKDGNPFLREIHITMHLTPPVAISKFSPRIDRQWVEQHTDIRPEELTEFRGLSTNIIIENRANADTYSLHQLQSRLCVVEDECLGEFNKTVEFQDAYLECDGRRLKLLSYEISYVRSAPFVSEVVIDFSKELIGVIEYLNKGSTTAVFKDRVISDWR